MCNVASPCSTMPAPPSTTVLSSRFIVPMNSATNGVAGALYISAGEPICSMRPRYITATWSETESASSWSCVT